MICHQCGDHYDGSCEEAADLRTKLDGAVVLLRRIVVNCQQLPPSTVAGAVNVDRADIQAAADWLDPRRVR